MTTEIPEFLDTEDVLELHTLQLARYGGADGVRDRGLLESALAQAQATFDGEFVHPDLFAMAAAYLFHVVQNHPFVDGNKRTGFVVGVLFLELNGYRFTASEEAAAQAVLELAASTVDEVGFCEFLRADSERT